MQFLWYLPGSMLSLLPREWPASPYCIVLPCMPERLGTSAEFAAGILDYPPLLQIISRREHFINQSAHECQIEGRHSPNVILCDRIGHWPCWLCCVARVIPFPSVSFSLGLSKAALAGALAMDLHLPKRFHLNSWLGPLISSKAKIFSDFLISSCTLNIHPKWRCGITSWTPFSLVCVHCVLILQILYSWAALFVHSYHIEQSMVAIPATSLCTDWFPLHFFQRQKSYFVYHKWLNWKNRILLSEQGRLC